MPYLRGEVVENRHKLVMQSPNLEGPIHRAARKMGARSLSWVEELGGRGISILHECGFSEIPLVKSEEPGYVGY
jgi:hypothetical protein